MSKSYLYLIFKTNMAKTKTPVTALAKMMAKLSMTKP